MTHVSVWSTRGAKERPPPQPINPIMGGTVMDNQSPLICQMSFPDGGSNPDRQEIIKYNTFHHVDKINMSRSCKIIELRF